MKGNILKLKSVALIILLFMASCSPDKPDPENNSKKVVLDIIDDDAVTHHPLNLQVDFDYNNATDGIPIFDINVQDYSPQTFSIGILSYVPEGAQLQINKQYPIQSWDVLNDDFVFMGMFNHNPNWEPYSFDQEIEDIFYETSFYNGGGYVEFYKVSDDEIKGYFTFIAYAYYGLSAMRQIEVHCTFTANKRNSLLD